MKLLAMTMLGLVVGECCRDVEPRRAFLYGRLAKNAQSTESVITRKRVGNLDGCKDLAESKRALAFNFVRRSLNASYGAANHENCVLLHCPETAGLGRLIGVAGTDYYSAYSSHAHSGSNDSLACVRSVGLFAINFQKKSFSNARGDCRKNQRFLADVLSDERTRGLGNFIDKLTVYVGLSNEGVPRIWKNEFGEALACHDYRAWGLGEPSNSRGCVAMFRLEPKADPVWRVVSCTIELPYICEIPRLNDRLYLDQINS